MATSLEGNRVNRLTINPTSDHTQESFEGNIDVTLLNSVLIHSTKKNVRVYTRNTQTGVWSVSSIIGPTADSEEGLGEKHYKSAAIQTTNSDRISIVPIDATASAKIRIVHSKVLPSSSFARGTGASKANEYELTSLVAGVAQTINNVTGMPIVQVFEQTTATASTALSYTGADQSFVVPAGVTSLTAKLWGAGGSGGSNALGGAFIGGKGGAGGYATGTIAVTPGETLNLVVGQGGGYSFTNATPVTYGGGGRGNFTLPATWSSAGGGGGYAGIFRGAISQSNALLIAGAGAGGSGHFASNYDAGVGGGTSGTHGTNSGGGTGPTMNGSGGTQSAGGAAGTATRAGSAGTALQGGYGDHISGGGGAGYFGGGGGGHQDGSGISSTGGGGSSFLGTASAASTTAGSGVLPPQQSDADYVAGVGLGGERQTAGGNALIVLSYSTGGGSTLTDKTHNYTVTHDSSTNQLSVTSDSPVATIKVRVATA